MMVKEEPSCQAMRSLWILKVPELGTKIDDAGAQVFSARCTRALALAPAALNTSMPRRGCKGQLYRMIFVVQGDEEDGGWDRSI